MEIRPLGRAKLSKVLLALSVLLSCSLSIGKVSASESDSEQSHVPVISYAADVEVSPSQGTAIAIGHCFSQNGVPLKTAVCPTIPFTKAFTKVVVTLPESLHWVSASNTGIFTGVGFTCSPGSTFNLTIAAKSQSLIYSGFNCKVNLASIASVFALQGIAATTRKLNVPSVLSLRSTITPADGQEISTERLNGFAQSSNPGLSSYPQGLDCLAVVAVGSHYCVLPAS